MSTSPSEHKEKEGYGFLGALLILLLTALGIVLSWILKPLLTYLFTFEGRTKQQIQNQLVIIVILFGAPVLLAYTFSPSLRDFVSLSKNHTINVTNGYRILFVDRAYFINYGKNAVLPQEIQGKKYVTYAGNTKPYPQKVVQNYCYLIPRGESMFIASTFPPVQAEGFEEKITYHLRESMASLEGFEYWWERVTRPNHWFKQRWEVKDVYLIEEVRTSWSVFLRNWDSIYATNTYKLYAVEALSDEHAIVCF